MRFSASVRHTLALLAIASMLMVALAPPIARLLAASTALRMTGSGGMRGMAAMQGGMHGLSPPDAMAPAHAMGHVHEMDDMHDMHDMHDMYHMHDMPPMRGMGATDMADATPQAGDPRSGPRSDANTAMNDAPPQPSDAMHHAMHMDHCGYCFFDAHAPAVLQVAAAFAGDAVRFTAQPLLFFQAPHALHAWTSAQPRAPPTFL